MVYIIVRNGTKKQRLLKRHNELNGYLNKELRGPGEKGKVYDFGEWGDTKVKDKKLGTDRNASRFKEAKEIKNEFKRKGDEI
ncbi:MAG: hypothetical protein ABIA66_01210 [Candidatus Omnitrophota bacterium]